MRYPVRVLHVIGGLGAGGAETMLHKLLGAMPRDQFDSRVMSLGDAGVFGPKLETSGIPVCCLSLQSLRLGADALWRLISDRELAGWRPDVLQGWMYHGNLACQVMSDVGLHNGPVIWNIRQNLDEFGHLKAATRLVIGLGGLLSGRASRVVSNSRSAVDSHSRQGYGRAPWTLIPNGFDLDRFKPDAGARDRVRKQLGITADAFLVGMVARLHPVKGHRVILEAAVRIQDQRPDVHFLLVGRGVEDGCEAFEELRHDLPRSSGIHALGERMEDLPELMAAMDVLVSASFSEAFSNTLGEAMACAVPCVVTDVGDSAWIVGDYGLVVPPGDARALASAILQVAEMEKSKREDWGNQARAWVSRCFSLTAIASQYGKLYEDALHDDRVV